MKRLILPLLAAFFFVLPWQTKADTGPMYFESAGIQLFQESPVRLDHEIVRFEIPLTIGGRGSEIPTTATFWLINPTDQDIVVTSTFPLRDAIDQLYVDPKSVSISMDGKLVATTLMTTPYPTRDPHSGSFKEIITEGYEFLLKIRPHTTSTVVVRYFAPTGPTDKCSNRDEQLSYYLGSGAGWNGSIREARIEVEYPLDNSTDLMRLSGGYYGGPAMSPPTKTELTGDTVTYVYENLEPNASSTLYVDFRNVGAEQADRDARKYIAEYPTDPKGYFDLGETIKGLELKYGSSTNPNTGEGAYEAADFYTGEFSFLPDGQCAAYLDPIPVNILLANIRNHAWLPSDYSNLQRLQDRLDNVMSGWQGEDQGVSLKQYGYDLPLTLAPLPFIHVSTSTNEADIVSDERLPVSGIDPRTLQRNRSTGTLRYTATKPFPSEFGIALAFLMLAILDGLIAFLLWSRWMRVKKQ